jgi:hypothetical protein
VTPAARAPHPLGTVIGYLLALLAIAAVAGWTVGA